MGLINGNVNAVHGNVGKNVIKTLPHKVKSASDILTLTDDRTFQGTWDRTAGETLMLSDNITIEKNL